MERTCWRGVSIEHPALWEIAVAFAPPEDGRLTFVDRRYTRMDMRWRTLKYVPDMKDMLYRFQRDAKKADDDGVETLPLKGVPEPWKGFVRRGKQGSVIHATRFFKEQRLLVETVIVWPKDRHRDLERYILESVSVADAKGAKTEPWRALGLEADVPAGFRLTDNNARVGRVAWTFAAPAEKQERTKNEKQPPQLIVERLAMVDQWLAKPLEEWLKGELPPASGVLGSEKVLFNGHDAQQLLSATKIGTVGTVLGWRRYRLDVAWRCESDLRLYHVAWSMTAKKGHPIALPTALRVACCQPPPVVVDDVEL